MAAGVRVFAKIPQQHLAPTIQCLGQTQQSVQPPMVGMAAFGRGQPFVDLLAAVADIVRAKQRERFGGGTVAARTTDFLIV